MCSLERFVRNTIYLNRKDMIPVCIYDRCDEIEEECEYCKVDYPDTYKECKRITKMFDK